tara:strand:- start:857 stop:1354 length:498 start_codon:yes stop_codon:yes gene_type:complete
MVLYNSNNTITKYDNVLDILREFCDIRLELYEVRKTYMIDELQREIDLMAIKIRFINEFIEEKITIIRVKKVDIIEQLKSKGYPEIEGYDYLLKMPIYNLTFEKIDEFEKKLANLNEELELIKSKSKQDLWREDIDMIRNELKNYGYNKLQTKKLKVKLQKGKVK